MMGTIPPDARAVLEFWFGPADAPEYGAFRKAWFEKEPAFDDQIRDRFGSLWLAASRGDLDAWRDDAHACLALCIVLDQFPRNMHRGSSLAFATDDRAREVARHALTRGHDRKLLPMMRLFNFLPFEHSEVLADQDLAVILFASLTAMTLRKESIASARRHREIIVRFGRFPHRNAALGRATTAAEAAFLGQPNSSF